MRHRIYGKRLSRNKDERRRLFKGLISQLFLYGSIQTSEAKAKAVKGLVDKIINSAKNNNTRRLLQIYLTDRNLQKRLIEEIVPKLGNKTSGYTSLVRLGPRMGDQTMMVKVSLIGAEGLKPLEKVTRKTEEKLKKPTIRKATPAKKVTQEKTTSRRRTAK